MEKYGLVLEGGGMRGAYTAGALAWLNDNNITFDYGVGISSGAVYLACYWEGDKHTPHNMSVNYAADSENVGIKAILNSGHIVDYDRIFDHDLFGKEHMNLMPLKENHANVEFGAYDMVNGTTDYYGTDTLDEQCTILHAAIALPLCYKIVDFEDKKLMDGGIIKMIPIERSVEQGCTKHLVISTKPASYVRKPASKAVIFLMRVVYHKYPKIVEHYKNRHLNYYKQIEIIDNLEKEGNAIHMRPSRSIKMGRFKGSQENCKELYDLGYADMEARREDIMKFMGNEKIQIPAVMKEKETVR